MHDLACQQCVKIRIDYGLPPRLPFRAPTAPHITDRSVWLPHCGLRVRKAMGTVVNIMQLSVNVLKGDIPARNRSDYPFQPLPRRSSE